MNEASIRSDDPLQRAWGEKGKTPIVKTSGQRQATNTISGFANKGGWYHVFDGKFNMDKCIEHLERFKRDFNHSL